MSERLIPDPSSPADSAPGTDAVDVVPGVPPVPITVWRTRAADDRGCLSPNLAARLLGAYTRPGELVVDATADPGFADAVTTAGRHHRPVPRRGGKIADEAALAVCTWPLPPTGVDPVIVLGGLRRRLRPGGILAAVVAGCAPGDPPVDLGPLVQAAAQAKLSYLQHIVAVHARPGGETITAAPGDAAQAVRAGLGGAAHRRVHTDVVVLTRPGGQHG